MIQPAIPANEQERLSSLASYYLTDELPGVIYDDIARIAAEICGTPIALLNIIGEKEQVTKAGVGLDKGRAPREISMCAHAINQPNEVMVVNDTRFDHRFHDNPFTLADLPTIFYAGVPVLDTKGLALGTICVVDTKPKELSDEKLEALKSLARLVETHLELRKNRIDSSKTEQQIFKAKSLLQDIKNNGSQTAISELEILLDEMGR